MENRGALFQVASQFNLLEMVAPGITPEHGVTRYAHDMTQGPACAIAAGAGTIYRNYFVPIGSRYGQTASQQLDALADVGALLSCELGISADQLWTMRDGYALAAERGIDDITRYLKNASDNERDALRAKLCVGLHRDVEVTDVGARERPIVSQVYCSALPVSYSNIPCERWAAFASLILEAAYEATLRCAVENAARGFSNKVFITRLGGGAFGNRSDWIDAAIQRALELLEREELEVRLVSHETPTGAGGLDVDI